jgi:hypothetical protein
VEGHVADWLKLRSGEIHGDPGRDGQTDLVLWLVILAVLAFVVAILYVVMRKPGEGHLLVHAVLVPLSFLSFLALGFALLLWGVLIEPRTTIPLEGLSISADSLRRVSGDLGIGIITGVVAGAAIALAQRWHDFERTVDWGEFLRRRLERKGYRLTEVDGGGYLVEPPSGRGDMD